MISRPLLHRSERSNAQIPLRVVLIVPFVIQLVGVVGLVGYFSYRNGQETIQNLANQLLTEVSARINQKLVDYLEDAQRVNRINADAIATGDLNLTHLGHLEPYLHRQLKEFNTLNSIVIATEKPDYVGIGYSDNDRSSLYISVWNPAKGGTFDWVVDAQGNRELLGEDTEYDHRTRSWYQDTVKAGKPIWSEIFTSITPKNLILSANQPFYDAEGKLQGVASSDIGLGQIGQFLQTLRIGQTGQAFIIERDGSLIAASTIPDPYTVTADGEDLERINAVDSTEPLVQQTATYLTQTLADLSQINSPQSFKISVNRSPMFVVVTPFHDERGIDWLVVTVLPAVDLSAEINRNTRTTVLLCGLAAIASITVSLLMARWIARPLLNLNVAAQNLMQGQFETPMEISQIREVGNLAQAFQQMADQLQTSLQTLESYNRLLAVKFDSFFKATPAGMAILDEQLRFVQMNEPFAQINGSPVDTQVGCTLQQVLPQLAPSIAPLHHQVLATGQPVLNQELSGETPSQPGQQRYWIASYCLIDSPDEPAALVGMVVVEISDRKHAELELQQAKIAAEVANQSKSIFLANMSHELRTPLNVILGFAQIMSHDDSLHPDQQENLRRIGHSGDHLLNLINDILDLSKIEAGRLTLDASTVDLITLLHTLQDMFTQRAATQGLRFSLQLATDLPSFVTLDANKLRQVLINLLSNAVKFTAQGGVTLSVQSLPDRLAPSPGVWLDFAITDTGVGIAPDELDTVFDAFTQAQAGRTSSEGTGLGLAISQRFVQLMGGTLSVQSTLGEGSTFHVQIPVEVVPAPDSTNPASNPVVIGLAPNQPHYRILVVDDQEANRELMVSWLSRLSLEVKQAKTGEAAIQLWQQWQPDLIWMDLRMPHLDGYETTRRIRQLEAERSPTPSPIPIVALTAQAFAEDYAAAIAAGCTDFVTKPVQEATVFNVLAEHLGLRYQYVEQAIAPPHSLPNSVSLHPDDLAVMPSEWIAAFQQAVITGYSEGIETLIQEIPIEHTTLIHGLKRLNYDYQFDVMLQLSQSTSPSSILGDAAV